MKHFKTGVSTFIFFVQAYPSGSTVLGRQICSPYLDML